MSPQLEQYLTAFFLALICDEMTVEQALDRSAAVLSKDQALKLLEQMIELRTRPGDVAVVEDACLQVAHHFGYSMNGTVSGLSEAIVVRVSVSSRQVKSRTGAGWWSNNAIQGRGDRDHWLVPR